jgi:hypothetical protein
LNLFKTAVYSFLATYTESSPRHRDKPLRGNVVITLLAYTEAASLGTTEGRASVPKLIKVTVEVTNIECALRSRLGLFQLIGASLNRDAIAPSDEAFQSTTFAVRIARNRSASVLVIVSPPSLALIVKRFLSAANPG